MNVFAISDLHLTGRVDKPMDIFGMNWVGHWDKIRADWMGKVTDDDLVLIAGDISWAMKTEDALVDLTDIEELPGKKCMIRGNHDYWWCSPSKTAALGFKSILFLQNNAYCFGDYVVCGSRGWTIPENGAVQTEEDKKIFDRETIRLELSLQQASAVADGREIIGMMHYPPFPFSCESTPWTDLFEKYGVRRVVYGHLHGKQAHGARPITDIHGIKYYLTSCDFLQNALLRL